MDDLIPRFANDRTSQSNRSDPRSEDIYDLLVSSGSKTTAIVPVVARCFRGVSHQVGQPFVRCLEQVAAMRVLRHHTGLNTAQHDMTRVRDHPLCNHGWELRGGKHP